jgi:hypothetical protein
MLEDEISIDSTAYVSFQELRTLNGSPQHHPGPIVSSTSSLHIGKLLSEQYVPDNHGNSKGIRKSALCWYNWAEFIDVLDSARQCELI